MRALLVAALLVTSSPTHAASLTFSDGTFADAAWTATKVVDTTAGATATFAAAQSGSGGNPGSYRHITHTYDLGTIAVAHLFGAASVDPGLTGAISAVDFGYDLTHLNPPPSQAVAFSLVLQQGGATYRSALDNAFVEAWTSFSHTGLVASNFTLLAGSGPANPDFSAFAAPITAGFVSLNSNSGGTPGLVRTSGIDNWTVTFHFVPEPAAAALLATAAIALARRRRAV